MPLVSTVQLLDAEKAYPNLRTPVWLDFPWLIVTRGMSDLYTEAHQFLDWRDPHSLFPIEEYRLATVLAFLADECGDSHSARNYASVALNAAAKEDSGLRYHAKLGLVAQQDAAIENRLKALAATDV